MVRGAEKIITKIWHAKSVHKSTVGEIGLCNKKEGCFFPTTEDTVPTVCFKLVFLLFVKWLIDASVEMSLCILFVRETYTQDTEWNPGFQGGKVIHNNKTFF